MPKFVPETTALLLIDVQRGIVAMPLSPNTGLEVAERSRRLANICRTAGAKIVLVRHTFASDYSDAPPLNVDNPIIRHPKGLPEGWSDLVEDLAEPGDIIITKRQWGAFYGTDLELHLRRRGIKTLILGGIATNFGVESTARQAWEMGFELCLVEEACSSLSTELHTMSIQHVFPRISRVIHEEDICF